MRAFPDPRDRSRAAARSARRGRRSASATKRDAVEAAVGNRNRTPANRIDQVADANGWFVTSSAAITVEPNTRHRSLPPEHVRTGGRTARSIPANGSRIPPADIATNPPATPRPSFNSASRGHQPIHQRHHKPPLTGPHRALGPVNGSLARRGRCPNRGRNRLLRLHPAPSVPPTR